MSVQKGGLTYPCEIERGHAIRKCDHCGGRYYLAFRPSKRKWKKYNLLKIVRVWINEQIKLEKMYITAEEIAATFRAKIGMVRHVLHFLNLEGLVSQKSNTMPHDCRRSKSPYDWPCDNSWKASYYACKKTST